MTTTSTSARTARAALVHRALQASRESSTAAVLLHAAVAAQLGLVPTDEKALEALDRLGPMTAGDLAQSTGLTPSSTTSLVDRLVEKRLARRLADDGDRRRVLVQATAAERPEFRAIFEPIGQEVSALIATYDDEQLEAIADFLAKSAAVARKHTAIAAKRKKRGARK